MEKEPETAAVNLTQPEVISEVLRLARSIGNEIAEARVGDLMKLVTSLNSQLNDVRLEGAEHQNFYEKSRPAMVKLAAE